ncbi:MAG: ASCH domain-containing protein [Frankiaceae bacterium]|nr:ASCH domain-containing protein [Frankiaceae bacterium]
MTFDAVGSADTAGLPTAEFAFPGRLRDRLVAAILDGSKTSTTGLALEHQREDERLPQVGDRSVLVDSDGRPVAVLEVTSIRFVPLAEVDLSHARDEGEGHQTVAQWRDGHESFWHSSQMRAELGNPDLTVDDATLVVLERFDVVARLPHGPASRSSGVQRAGRRTTTGHLRSR